MSYRRHDKASIHRIIRTDPLWGILPCRRCGKTFADHRWIVVDPTNNHVQQCSNR